MFFSLFQEIGFHEISQIEQLVLNVQWEPNGLWIQGVYSFLRKYVHYAVFLFQPILFEASCSGLESFFDYHLQILYILVKKPFFSGDRLNLLSRMLEPSFDRFLRPQWREK